MNKFEQVTSDDLQMSLAGVGGYFQGLVGISREGGMSGGDCLPPCEQTDSCENITFQQLPLQLVKHSKECRTTAFATSKSYLGI